MYLIPVGLNKTGMSTLSSIHIPGVTSGMERERVKEKGNGILV